jgi:hypothetical protein
MSFANIQTNLARCKNIVPATTMGADPASLPDFSFYVPDVWDDGHDTGVAYADKWLQEKFTPYFGNLVDPNDPDPAVRATYVPPMKDVLFIVTFDEGDLSPDNRVYAVLHGDSVQPLTPPQPSFNHYSLLRTIEDSLGLGTLGLEDQRAVPITGVWRTTPSTGPGPGPDVTIQFLADGQAPHVEADGTLDFATGTSGTLLSWNLSSRLPAGTPLHWGGTNPTGAPIDDPTGTIDSPGSTLLGDKELGAYSRYAFVVESGKKRIVSPTYRLGVVKTKTW